jgi:hypothetical protein
MISDLLDLDATAVLNAAEALEAEQRERAVDDLRLVLQWADLHSTDPGEGRALGADQLAEYGGDGTPPVQELCWAELAIARQASLVATKRLAADALDLRHRLPLLWEAVQDLRLPAWVARKVASMSRSLSKDTVGLVDVAVAAAVDQSPGRILTIAEAKVIEADIEAHRARLAADAADIGVRMSRPQPGAALDALDGEPATGRLTLKLPMGTALGFDASVDEVADAIHDQLPEDQRRTVARGELQAMAVKLLSNPHAAAAFLDEVNSPATVSPDESDAPVIPKPKKRPATIYVHLSDLVLAGTVAGVARIEGIGPMLVEQLAELLEHRDVTVQPLIDLNRSHSVNGYEHPTLVKHRTVLRMLGDVFPHSANLGYRRLDHDHASPYVPHDCGGPPGQTGDHNDAPLTRTHHRVKTHAGYELRQLGLGVYRWVTPHGLGRLVTTGGTRRFEPIISASGSIGELYFADRQRTG